MEVTIYTGLVILANLIFVILLARRAYIARYVMHGEKGNPIILAVYSFVLQFFAAFGISDFSISIIVYKKFHLVEDKKIPGTLMTSCVVPVGVMAIGYLSVINVEVTTLIVCVGCGLGGAVVGTFLVSKMNEKMINLLMIVALSIAAIMITIKQLGLMPAGGDTFGFSGWRLILVAIFTFGLSILSMGGFATTAILLCFFYLLGLNPIAAFPLAMGTSSLSCAIGGIRYTLKGRFGKKLAVLSTIFGSAGAFVAVHFVKNLNVEIIQWVILAVIVYSVVSLSIEYVHKKKDEGISKELSEKKKIELNAMNKENKKIIEGGNRV